MKAFSLSGFPRKSSVLVVLISNVRSFLGYDNTYKPVPRATTGQTELNLMFSFAYSTPIALVALMTAAFDALYQTNPGLGRIPAVEAMFTNAPPLPFFCIYGTIVFAE
jgi:hypothetical protein